MPSDGVEVPFQISGNFIFVDLMINDSGPYTFILDTGASTVVVSPQIANLYSDNVLGPATVSSELADADSQAIRINTLQLGAGRFETFDAFVVDVDQVLRNELDPSLTIDGILGYPLFETLLLIVDYPEKKVLVQTGTLPPEDGCNVLPMKTNDEGLLTMAVSVDRRTQQAIIDTGFNGFIKLPSGFENLPFLEPPSLQSITLITGPADVLFGRLPDGSVTLGCFKSSTAKVLVGGNSANIGAAAFLGFEITIDQQSNRIRIR